MSMSQRENVFELLEIAGGFLFVIGFFAILIGGIFPLLNVSTIDPLFTDSWVRFLNTRGYSIVIGGIGSMIIGVAMLMIYRMAMRADDKLRTQSRRVL